MDALWPLRTAVVGVHDEPAPEGSGITSVYVAPETYENDVFTRSAAKAAVAATRLNDWLHGLLP